MKLIILLGLLASCGRPDILHICTCLGQSDDKFFAKTVETYYPKLFTRECELRSDWFATICEKED